METAAAGASGQYWIRKVWETRHVHLELKVTVLDYKLMSDVRGKGGGRFEPWWGDKVVYLGKLLLSTYLSPTRNINEYKQIVRGGVTKFLVVTCNWVVYYPERIIWTLVFWNPLPILVTFAFTRFAVSLSLRFWNLLHPISVPDLLLFNRSVYYLSFLPFILLTPLSPWPYPCLSSALLPSPTICSHPTHAH